ncbi:MAG: TAXI family TRAP transporter solute-binding subunit [SAR324 cluster bacterium]|nr:TAXI family TRAP transporter solute-binding subunit [SAR324 cluster bacterium]
MTDHPGTGSYEFGQEMARLFGEALSENEYPLTVRPWSESSERLSMLRNRQADMAIIDAQSAHSDLGKDLRLRVVSVLWPNFLHAVVNRLTLAQPSILSARSMLIHPNAMHAAQVWTSMVPEAEPVWWDQQVRDLQNLGLVQDGLLITAPVPVMELRQMLGRFETLKLASLEPSFILRLRQNSPWWKKWKLAKGFYPGQTETVLGLASFSVLVARVDFPPDLTEKWLKLLYSQKNKINPHFLLRNLDTKYNSLFKDTYHFHPKSRAFFKF